MAHHIDLTEASVYVGTYRKYNEGSIFGKWLKLSDYSGTEEFFDACRELHSDEEDPEFMFQDYENIPKGLISECSMSDNIFEVLEALQEMDDSRKEAFLIWCDNDHKDLPSEDIDELILNFDSEYIGQYENEEDFAYQLIDDRNDLSEFERSYFNYKAYAHDIFISDYWFVDGHVFYR